MIQWSLPWQSNKKSQTIPSVWLFIVWAICPGCIDPYAPNLLSIDYGILVIDGYFVPNDTTRIRLSRTVTVDARNAGDTEPPALVRIESNDGFSYTLSSSGNRLYTAPPMTVDTQSQYRLTVRTADGRLYESDYVPLKTQTSLDSVRIHEPPGDDLVGFRVFAHDSSNASHYYSFQYDETWQYATAYNSIFKWENGKIVPRIRADELKTCWKTRSSTDIRLATTTQLSADVVYDFPLIEMQQSDRRLYFAYSVLVRQYVLTPEAHQYWSIVNQNSELGGLFDRVPSQPPGNFYCSSEPGRPVVGFFSASEVSTQRFFINRFGLRGPREPYQPTGYENCEPTFIPLQDISEQNLHEALIIEGQYEAFTSRLLGYLVSTTYCVDCRAQGGTTNRPSYWE